MTKFTGRAADKQHNRTDIFKGCKVCPDRDTCRVLCDAMKAEIPSMELGRKHREFCTDFANWAPEDDREIPPTKAEMMEAFDKIRRHLTKRQREAVKCVVIDRMSPESAGKKIGIRRSSVMTYIARCRPVLSTVRALSERIHPDDRLKYGKNGRS